MVLVEAPGARDAIVSNAPGLRVDGRGYAVVPYVSPYRLNTVTLDPQGMAHDVELESTSQSIAPFAGAISYLRFDTRKGNALLIRYATRMAAACRSVRRSRMSRASRSAWSAGRPPVRAQ